MTTKQRLDLVVEVKEREEEAATDAWRAAAQVTRTRQTELASLRAAAMQDGRQRSDAYEWELGDRAHARLLEAIRLAEGRLEAALKAEAVARDSMAAAHRSAEAVRRVAEARREDALQEENRRERKDMDEVAMQKAARKRLEGKGR
jgi:flagellar biosynthesis chaperone FliJ